MIINYINWHPSPEMFTIGNFGLRWYGFLFAMGFFIAYFILSRIFKRENVSLKLLDWLTFYIFLAVLIGARLGHCFFYEWDYYKHNLSEIPMVWKGGLASHGAGIAIIIALLIYVKNFKIDPWWLFDRIAIVIPIAAAFVRFGNLMNSEIYGITTDLPWGFVFLNDKHAGLLPRHPTQLYEAFSYILITLILLWFYYKRKTNIRKGLFVGIFLISMFTLRFLIEFLKEVQVDFEKNLVLNMGQWLSIPFILLGIAFVFYTYRKSKAKDF